MWSLLCRRVPRFLRKRLLETFCCTNCVDSLKDPATNPCGQSYCMSCIHTHWTGEVMMVWLLLCRCVPVKGLLVELSKSSVEPSLTEDVLKDTG